jgi:arylsulfate sulfotransferase
MIRNLLKYTVAVLCLLSIASCSGENGNIIREIHVGLHNNNALKIQLDVITTEPADVYAEYWTDQSAGKEKFHSSVIKGTTAHTLVLMNINPATNYKYQIVTSVKGNRSISKEYTFQSHDLPLWLQEQFRAKTAANTKVPEAFASGLMLINKRYAPGAAYLVDHSGKIRWYHMVDGLGFKVIHYTKAQTILAILGRNDEPTSYGSEILELDLLGDTVLHLKKGQGDFKQTIHHEIIKNDKEQLVTLFVDDKLQDLTAIGGSRKDTIAGDGILVMDKHGKQIWRWSVFDALDPIKDPHLLATKKDWMHANSLNYDADGNYIMSFYNNGQIWKINSRTGKVMWKFGKGGNITMPAECNFTQAHAAHINADGNLMFFDNGIEKHQSGVFALKVDEEKKSAVMNLHIKLPKEIFNGRMGSAYLVNGNTVLCCCSKRHIIVLTDRKGVLLWTMETSVPSYRAEFIKSADLPSYFKSTKGTI